MNKKNPNQTHKIPKKKSKIGTNASWNREMMTKDIAATTKNGTTDSLSESSKWRDENVLNVLAKYIYHIFHLYTTISVTCFSSNPFLLHSIDVSSIVKPFSSLICSTPSLITLPPLIIGVYDMIWTPQNILIYIFFIDPSKFKGSNNNNNNEIVKYDDWSHPT